MVESAGRFTSEDSTGDAGRQSPPSAVRESVSSPFVGRDPTKKWPTTAEEFDQMFDDGEDISHLIDWSSARQVGLAMRRVNVDFPDWMVRSLDVHAKKRGVTRQALIKMWLADRLEAAGSGGG